MKEIPLLYSTPMVQAKLAGRKTVTRRIIKPQPDARGLRTTNFEYEDWHGREIKCPWRAGNVIWGRETWQKANDHNGEFSHYIYFADNDPLHSHIKWKPSIHMPKSAARIWERVVSVRPEQLSGITKEDAIKEGIERIHVEIAPSPANDWQGDFDYAWVDYLHMGDYAGWGGDACSFRNPIDSFESLWKSINGSFNPNTWVWRIETEVLSITGKP